MSEELREKIARELQREAYERDAGLAEIAEHEIAPLYYAMADRILALPELRDRLYLQPIETMPTRRQIEDRIPDEVKQAFPNAEWVGVQSNSEGGFSCEAIIDGERREATVHVASRLNLADHLVAIAAAKADLIRQLGEPMPTR